MVKSLEELKLNIEKFMVLNLFKCNPILIFLEGKGIIIKKEKKMEFGQSYMKNLGSIF